MSKIRVMPLGSCRIYRPFLSRRSGVLYDNTFPEIEVVYPRCGFFHSPAEILQTMQLMKFGFNTSARENVKYLFRKEPEHTTPSNVFYSDIIESFTFPVDFESVDAVLIEISSLDYFYYEDGDLYFHWNPNFIKDVSYGEIYPDGFYENFTPSLNVQKRTLDCEELSEIFVRMCNLLGGKKLFVTTHINDESVWKRKKLFEVCEEAVDACRSDITIINNSHVHSRHGYNIVNGNTDIHHLSPVGEIELGNLLQKNLIKRLGNNVV